MASVEAVVVVDVPIDVAFAVSQTHGAVRLRWDPFIAAQHFLDGSIEPGKGVRTFTRQRFGLGMVSEYVSFSPPTNVGMKMVRGPWFFDMFGGGWRFASEPGGRTRATWRYTFRCRPGFLRPVMEPVGKWLLGREIRRRIDGYAKGCRDEVVVAEAERMIADLRSGGGRGTD